jgi:hypothetical protein
MNYVNTVALGIEFRGRCWRHRRYRGQNLLECPVKYREYSFRGRNLGDAAGDSLKLHCSIYLRALTVDNNVVRHNL